MQISLTPEQETLLNSLSASSGKRKEQLVSEALMKYLEYEQWFAGKVQEGMDSLERGEFVEHKEVLARIDRMFQS